MNTIEISVTGGGMSPRYIEVGAEGQKGGYELSLSFDDTWSGLDKSVVFYDKRREKVVSYDFLADGAVSVVIPEGAMAEDGRHPFLIVGAKTASTAEGGTVTEAQKLSECGFICVGETVYPELNTASAGELDADAYSSFLEAYKGCKKLFDAMSDEYGNLVESLGTGQSYATLSESYAKGGTGKREGESTDNSKYYSEVAASKATAAESSAGKAKTYAEEAATNAASTNTALSEMSNMFLTGTSDVTIAKEKAEAAQGKAEAAQGKAEIAQTAAEAAKKEANTAAATASAYVTAAASSEANAKEYAESAERFKNSAATAEANAKKAESNASDSEKAAKAYKDEACEAAENVAGFAEVVEEDMLTASEKAAEAEIQATASKSYAVGGTGRRPGEDTDNAKYYCEKAKGYAEGCRFKGETAALPETAESGDIYKLSTEMVTGHYEIPIPSGLSVETDPSTGNEDIHFISLSRDSVLFSLFYYIQQGSYGMYGDNFDDYYYYIDGAKHMLPIPYSMSGGIVYGKDEIFEAYLLSNSTLICDITNTPNMPPEVANCLNRVVYPKGICFIWDGNAWKSLDADYASDIADNVVTAAKIKDNAVTTQKLAGKAVTGAKIADNTITSAKVSGSISVAKGGTGKTSWTANRLLYPSSTTAFTQLAFPTAESVLCQKTSGAPYWKKLSEIAGSSGGYKKIGYTDDCDYKVTSASGGKTAFTNAINAAASGDTILVMPGEYGGTGDLSVAKNLTFIGIRENGKPKPKITFGIRTECEYTMGESGNIETSTTYTTNWTGFEITGGFDVGGTDGMGEVAQSYANATDCDFAAANISPSGTYTNCRIICTSDNGITGGRYYGIGSTYKGCMIEAKDFSGNPGWDNFEDCDIYITKDSYSSSRWHYGGADLTRCNLYILGTGSIDWGNVHGGAPTYSDCCLFKNSTLTDDYSGSGIPNFVRCLAFSGTSVTTT